MKRIYKGKYPQRINTIGGARNKETGKMVYTIELNNGDRYRLNTTREWLESVNYQMPELGTEIDLSTHEKIEPPAPATVDFSPNTFSPAKFAALARVPQIEAIENAGMDEGRFFVHLRAPWHWNESGYAKTGYNVARSKSFGSIKEVRIALQSIARA